MDIGVARLLLVRGSRGFVPQRASARFNNDTASQSSVTE